VPYRPVIVGAGPAGLAVAATLGRQGMSCAVLERAAWSENQGMYGTSMRENRESPCLPVRLISGWAAQGTLRRYA